MGYLRFSLIIAIVYFNLAEKSLAGPIALYGFFVLTGYLATLACCETYAHNKRGYLANRILRIWPGYLIAMLIALFAMSLNDYTTGLYQPGFVYPTSATSWLAQITLIFLPGYGDDPYSQRLLPQAYSLGAAVVFYAVSIFITARSRKYTAIAFLLSAIFAIYAAYADYPFRYLYTSVPGLAFPFFGGALFYHWRDAFKGLLIKNVWSLIALANLALWLPDIIGLPRSPLQLYGMTFYFGYIVLCLQQAPTIASRAERFLGDISYPIFLLQFSAGTIICYQKVHFYQHSPDIFFSTLPLLLIAGAAMVFAIERPLQKLRSRIRNN